MTVGGGAEIEEGFIAQKTRYGAEILTPFGMTVGLIRDYAKGGSDVYHCWMRGKEAAW
jgi:hypothetical protein